MGKDFYCPICGAFQEHVNLEETDNTFSVTSVNR